MLCGSSWWCHGLVCVVWLWYFLVELACYFNWTIFHGQISTTNNNCWHCNIYFMLSWVEHGKSFITSGPDQSTMVNNIMRIDVSIRINGHKAYQWCSKNAEKVTHIKVRILHQAVILFMYATLPNVTSLNTFTPNGVARTLKKLRTSKGEYCIKQWFSLITPHCQMGTSLNTFTAKRDCSNLPSTAKRNYSRNLKAQLISVYI